MPIAQVATVAPMIVPPRRALACDRARCSRAEGNLTLASEQQVAILCVTHCSNGQRAKRAYDALARTGLTNLEHVDASGMPDWVASRCTG